MSGQLPPAAGTVVTPAVQPKVSAAVRPKGSPAVRPEHVEGLAESQVRVAQLQVELQHLRHALGHDLRAPLRHITGFVQVLQEDHGSALPPEVQQHLATIAEAADNLNQQVTNLLRVAPKN